MYLKRLFLCFFHSSDHPGINPKLPGSFNNIICCLFTGIYFHPAAHIEYLVHFPVVRFAGILYHIKNNRRGKQVVFDDFHLFRYILQAFCLPAATAVDQAMNIIKLLFKLCF